LVDPESTYVRKKDGGEGKVYLKQSHHTIQWITNSFATYGEDWKNKLERVIRKPLTEHDVIVVGDFNVISPRNKGTITTADMQSVQAASIQDVAKV
jgi:exonuclease III